MRALVFDDDPALRAVLVEVLTNAGYEAEGAADGAAGMAMFRNKPADLVITDIVMPNQEGIETVRELRRISPGVKIIAISGGGRTGSLNFLRIAKEFGADAALAKPFRNPELIALVKQVLGQ